MAQHLRQFLGQFQRGIEVCVAGGGADTLLGVREAFRRFFQDGLGKPVPVAVVPQEGEARAWGLALSDDEALARARQAARGLEEKLPGVYHFYLAAEGGLHALELDGRLSYFVRSWVVLRGVAGETFGSSGSLQLPAHLVDGLAADQVPHTLPGTRRAGGILASLTGGLESRRSAVATATIHALSTKFFGILDRPPGGSGR